MDRGKKNRRSDILYYITLPYKKPESTSGDQRPTMKTLEQTNKQKLVMRTNWEMREKLLQCQGNLSDQEETTGLSKLGK